MNYIEKHVTIQYGDERMDWESAVSIDMMNEIYDKLLILDHCNGNGSLQLNEGERRYSVFGPMKKAAVLIQSIKKGDILKQEMLAFKRTKYVSDLSQTDAIWRIGKKVTKNLKAGTVLMAEHFIE